MKRLLVRGAIVVLALRLLWMYLIPAWSQIETDFPNYYTAARAVAQDRPLADLYDPEWFQRETQRAGIDGRIALFNYFTPFSALVMRPVAGLPPLTAKRIWILVSLAALGGSVLLVARALAAPRADVLLVALLGGDALGNNFTFGQFYLVLCLLLIVAVVYLASRPALAGWCLATAAVVKVFPAVLLGHIMLLRQWKVLVWTLVAIVALSGIGVAAMGWIPHRVYMEEVFDRTLRGEIQDPYSVQWNTLQALLRRALVREPALNPFPIMDAPAVFFLLRPFLGVAILIVTFYCIRARKLGFTEFGALIAAVSLTTPGQASYHQVLFFPAIAAAIHREHDIRMKALWAGAFACICSNYMGALTGFDSGPMMLLAFPRTYLVVALWICFLGWHQVSGINIRQVIAVSALVAVASGLPELRRWRMDEIDGAVMARPDEPGIMQTHPSIGAGGLVFSSLRREGYTLFHPSAFKTGLVYESGGRVFGRLPDGTALDAPDLAEPSLSAYSVVAIRDGVAVVERSGTSGWSELFRRRSVIHDAVSSPDGTAVAFSEWVDARYALREWNRRTGRFRTIAEGEADYRSPKYSPTGDWLAFSSNESGNWDIYRISLTDGRREVLTTSKANDLMPAYAPDGRTIFFASDRRRGYRFTAIYSIALSR